MKMSTVLMSPHCHNHLFCHLLPPQTSTDCLLVKEPFLFHKCDSSANWLSFYNRQSQ